MRAVDNQLAWMPSTLRTESGTPKPRQELALNAPVAGPPEKDFSMFGADGFSFADLIDVVNPLQHLPLVSTFYRESTGDEIAIAPRVMGATLFFGPFGLAGALANVFVEGSTGKDIGEHMTSWIMPDAEAPAPGATETALADSGFEPAAGYGGSGDLPAGHGPEDPVLAWARGESDWTRQQMQNRKPAPGKDGPVNEQPAARSDVFPDAAPLLRDAPPAAPEAPTTAPVGLAQMAVLSNDIRSAARAYEVAANLRPAG
jgi:hypothetical protein